MSFLNRTGIKISTNAIQSRNWNWLMGTRAPASAGLTRFWFETQGPKADLFDPTPPPLIAALSTAQAEWESVTTILGSNTFDVAGGIGPGGTIDFAYTGGNATITAGVPVFVDGSLADPTLGRYNMSPDNITSFWPEGYWMQSRAAAPCGFDYSFSLPIQCISFWLVDFGDYFGSMTLEWYSGATLVHSEVLPTSAGSGNGTLSFVGLATNEFTFDRLSFIITQLDPLDPDILGFDDISVGLANF